ncbi:hypothetical protein ACOSQ2_011974 [Xanthoceras sorbifolium]
MKFSFYLKIRWACELGALVLGALEVVVGMQRVAADAGGGGARGGAMKSRGEGNRDGASQVNIVSNNTHDNTCCSANVHVATRNSELVPHPTCPSPTGTDPSPKDSIPAVRTIQRKPTTLLS